MVEPNVMVKCSDHIMTIVLNRPKAMNSFNRELVNELTTVSLDL